MRLDEALMQPLGYGYVKARQVAEVIAPFARHYRVRDGELQNRGLPFTTQERHNLIDLLRLACAVAKLDESTVSPLPPAGGEPPKQTALAQLLLAFFDGGVLHNETLAHDVHELRRSLGRETRSWLEADEDDNERYWNENHAVATGHAYRRHDGRPLKFPVPEGAK